MTDEDPNDRTEYLHVRLEAGSPEELDGKIAEQQIEGFELVSVVSEASEWHAFMKRHVLNYDVDIVNGIEDLNAGIGVILNNELGLVTSGRIDELQSIVSCILSVVEKKHD